MNTEERSDKVRRPIERDFTELIAWQKAHEFVLEVYRFTEGFPKHDFGLTSQFRRAAVSIPANIAEGPRKRGPSDKVRSVSPNAEGKLDETIRLLNAYAAHVRH